MAMEKKDTGTERKYAQPERGGQGPMAGVRNPGLKAGPGDGAGAHGAYKASKGSVYMPKKSMD